MNGMSGMSDMDKKGAGAPPPAAPRPAADPADAAAGAMADQEQAVRESILATRPDPREPYEPAAMRDLADAFNAATTALLGKPLPTAMTAPTTPVSGPLPDAIFLPVVAVLQAVSAAAGGKFASAYRVDPAILADNAGLRTVAAILERIAKDKALAGALQQELPGAKAAARPPAPVREGMSPAMKYARRPAPPTGT